MERAGACLTARQSVASPAANGERLRVRAQKSPGPPASVCAFVASWMVGASLSCAAQPTPQTPHQKKASSKVEECASLNEYATVTGAASMDPSEVITQARASSDAGRP